MSELKWVENGHMDNECIKHIEGTIMKAFVVSVNFTDIHYHSDIEMFLVLLGSIRVDDIKEQHIARKNDIFIFNKDEPHGFARTNESNLILMLQFDSDSFAKTYPPIKNIRFNKQMIRKEKDPRYWELLKNNLLEIISIYTKKQEGYLLEMMANVYHIMFVMLQHGGPMELDEKTIVSDRRNMKRLGNVLHYIHKNYTGRVSLKEIAEKADLSMYYLSHFFTENMGISFQQYINKLRVERAETYLTSTNLSPRDISTDCGFSSYRYMKKVFRRKHSCSPVEYREKRPVKINEFEEGQRQIVLNIESALKEITDHSERVE